MNLGERICKLRTQKQLSQEELAQALGVSRQSISKWETGGAVPELEKLVRLSQVFGVTLDQLVLDDTPKMPEPEVRTVYVARDPTPAGKVCGIVLLCFAGVIFLMVALFGDLLAGLVLAAPFAACGLVCLLVKQHAGLWCCWIVYLFFDIYLRYPTGIHWQYALIPIVYAHGTPMQLIVSWVLLAVYATLVLVTAGKVYQASPGPWKRNAIGAGVGLSVYALSWFVMVLPAYEAQNDVVYHQSFRYVSAVSGWVRSLILTASLVYAILLARNLLRCKKKQ